MAEFEFKKHDREKIKPKIKSKRLFVTGSSRDEKSDTVLTSSFNEMSKSFANNNYLMPDGTNSDPVAGALIYMINEMQGDIEDLHSELSQSSYVSQVSEFSSIATASIGNISSSLIPNTEDKYNLGSSSREWHTSYMLTASIGGGIFTSASLAAGGGGGTADFSSVGENIVPDGDNTRDLGTSAKEFRNLYIDGTAYLDSIAGGLITGNMTLKSSLILPSVTQVSSISKGLLDMRNYSVAEIKQKSGAWLISLARAGSEFQEITIIGLTAGTIQHSSKGMPFTFSFANGSNLSVAAGTAYKFIADANLIWRQIL